MHLIGTHRLVDVHVSHVVADLIFTHSGWDVAPQIPSYQTKGLRALCGKQLSGKTVAKKVPQPSPCLLLPTCLCHSLGWVHIAGLLLSG